MSLHIDAAEGSIAERVLLPGDPLRAQFIAENYLENPVRYNKVRGMYGYTGSYKGQAVSVQGTGMGIPSISIYVHELINSYQAKRLIRVGSCGALQASLKIRDIVMALSASSNSSIITQKFQGSHYAPTADWELIKKAEKCAQKRGISLRAGNIFTSDDFYGEDAETWKKWAQYGILAVEMESASLYTLAARFQVQALSLLTVSDSLVTQEKTSAQERETSFTAMMELALETITDQE